MASGQAGKALGARVVGTLGPPPPSWPRVTSHTLSLSASLPPLRPTTLHADIYFHLRKEKTRGVQGNQDSGSFKVKESHTSRRYSSSTETQDPSRLPPACALRPAHYSR